MGTTDRQAKATVGEVLDALERVRAVGVTDAQFAAELGSGRPATMAEWKKRPRDAELRLSRYVLQATEARLLGVQDGLSADDQAAMLVGIADDARRILERVERAQAQLRGVSPPSAVPDSAKALGRALLEAQAHASAPPAKRRRHGGHR